MLKIIQTFLLIQVSKQDQLPPATKLNFYSDISSDKQDIHFVNIKIGSQKQQLKLWLSLIEPVSSIFKASPETLIIAPDKYDPINSSTAKLIQESAQEDQSFDDGDSVIRNETLKGQIYEDDLVFDFYNQIDTQTRIQFLAVDAIIEGEEPQKKNMIADGTLGLAPFSADIENKDRNFVYQLKKTGLIDQLVFSIYVSMKEGNTTHINFGGYDQEGVEGQNLEHEMNFLQTFDNTSWALQMQDVFLGENKIQNITQDQIRHAVFELAYPYIYIPMSDFNLMADEINKLYQNILCLPKIGKCYLPQSCDHYQNQGFLLSIVLKDQQNKTFQISLSQETMFLDFKLLESREKYQCFIPIFGQKQATKNTWFLGTPFLQNYYQIYDMTQLESQNILRVGIGKRNPNDQIGDSLVKKQIDQRKNSFWPLVLWISLSILLFCLIIILVRLYLKKRKEKKQLQKYFQQPKSRYTDNSNSSQDQKEQIQQLYNEYDSDQLIDQNHIYQDQKHNEDSNPYKNVKYNVNASNFTKSQSDYSTGFQKEAIH